MTTENWRHILYYQGQHDEFYKDSEDPSVSLTTHIDNSCGVCQPTDAARGKAFQNFWILIQNRFEGQAFTNHTITEFEGLKTYIDQYNSTEDSEEETRLAVHIFQRLRRVLTSIRYTEVPETDLDETEYI